MSFISRGLVYASLVSSFSQSVLSFQPCPIQGPRFPVPSGLAIDSIVQSGLKNTTAAYDEYIATGNGTYGPITPNTTSFSVGLFTATDALNSSAPSFYEYHYSAPSLTNHSQGSSSLDANSIFRLGSLTQVFTVWIFLAQAGEIAWTEPITKYLPELLQGVRSNESTIYQITWEEITLGDLAAHLAGVPRDYISNSNISIPNIPELELSPNGQFSCTEGGCTRTEFLADIASRPPIYSPGTTPIFSNVAFQLLAYALEGITNKAFGDMFTDTMKSIDASTSKLYTPPDSNAAIIPGDADSSGWDTNFGDESPALGMYSTVSDISRAGIAMLNSTLLPPATTRRWLKPLAHTSNLLNDVARPWIIYKATADQSPINPVIEVFTNYGSTGKYSSYMGLVPEYNVGFTILAADSEAAPDLNAHADLIAFIMLPALEKAAIQQAGVAFAGAYTSDEGKNSSDAAELVIEKPDGMPGLSLTNLTVGTTDVRAYLAKLNGIDPATVSVRLYPTDLKADLPDGSKQHAFRAVYQDEEALADGGTPTCISWLDVDKLSYNGKPLDLFVFTLDQNGAALSVEIPALNLDLTKES